MTTEVLVHINHLRNCLCPNLRVIWARLRQDVESLGATLVRTQCPDLSTGDASSWLKARIVVNPIYIELVLSLCRSLSIRLYHLSLRISKSLY